MTSFRDENVGRFEIEMDHMTRMKMSDSCRHFGENLPHSSFVEDFVFPTVFFEEDGEVTRRAKFGLDEEVTGLFPGVVEGDEVR